MIRLIGARQRSIIDLTTRVLHILPHRGGGGELYIDTLEPLAGYEHVRLPLSATRRPPRALASIAAHWPGAALEARRADLVMTHGDVAGMLSLPMLCAGPSIALTEGLHLLRRATGSRLALVRAGLRAVVRSADRTVIATESERDELAVFVPPRDHDRLLVIANTAPAVSAADRDGARAALGIRDVDVVALYVGQLEQRKDPLTAVRAVGYAADSGRPLVLLVVGDGPLRADVVANAGPAVRTLGYRDDIGPLLAAADIFVMPSAREGQSLAVLEAMRAGLAMVVSDGPGNPEAIGDAGVVVPFGDQRAFADVLARLVDDGDERRRLGAAARRRFAEHHSPERFLATMGALFEELVTAPGRGGGGAPA